jgi:magnesium-protoporphyrin IX monomethyl ester (oxidative) cyclase
MAATMMKANNQLARASVQGRAARVSARRAVVVRAAAASDDLGFKTMRNGIKEASDESLLTPRFYTT